MDGISGNLAGVDIESLIINQAEQTNKQNIMMQVDAYTFRKQQEIQRNSVLSLLGLGGNFNALA